MVSEYISRRVGMDKRDLEIHWILKCNLHQANLKFVACSYLKYFYNY